MAPPDAATSMEASPVRAALAGMADAKLPLADHDVRLGGYDGPIRRLHLNESVREAMEMVLAVGQLYPDAYGRNLTRRLAEKLDFPAEQIVLSNGSESLLQLACDLYLYEGKSAVMPEPSFPRYKTGALSCGAEARLVPLREDGVVNVDVMLERITENTAIVFAASPNNPTGGMMSEQEIRTLVEGVPPQIVLVFDEAYFEFAVQAGGPSALSILQHRRGPWMLTRTFSKAYALAGVRLGYALCSSRLVARDLFKIRPNFSVSSIALAAGIAALEDQQYSDWLVSETAHERSRLAAGLQQLGLVPLPSFSNFVAFPTSFPGAHIVQALRRRGILISGVHSALEGYDKYVRITVGSSLDTDAVLAALADELEHPS
eukprot:SM000213S06833  [mRNA]  locus=s213:133698:136844:- [translate_table: standard]